MAELTDEELQFLHDVLELARSGDAEQLAAAVDAGIPVNLTSPAGDCLLMLAAYHCHDTTVAELLSRGADHGRTNDRGQTPLGAATFRRSPTIVSMLLAAGADPRLGKPSAIEIADFFHLSDMQALLETPPDRSTAG